MEQPYHFLDINFEVTDEWRSLVPNGEYDKKHVILDSGARYLTDDTRYFFECAGITPAFGYVWSWPRLKSSLKSQVYHTDFPQVVAQVAINYLIQGDPGITEWKEYGELESLGMKNFPKEGYQVDEYIGDGSPGIRASLTDIPMMAKIDVPHRVLTQQITNTRWTYSLRMRDRRNNEFLTWKNAVQYLKHYIED